MPALTPQQLATNAACFRCIDAPWVTLYLAAQWAGVSDPQTIANNSSAFEGFTGTQADAALAYLLAVIAGGSTDPNTLAASASCLSCLDGQLASVQNYLLAVAGGGSTDPQTIANAATAYQSLPVTQSLLYLVYLKASISGVTADTLVNVSRCFLCADGDLSRIAASLLNSIAGGGSAPPPPAAPVATAATGATSVQFTANWGAVAGATSYAIDASTDIAFGTFLPGYSNLSTGALTTQVVSGLSPGTYYYRVRSVSANGTSANSNTITVVLVVTETPWITNFGPMNPFEGAGIDYARAFVIAGANVVLSALGCYTYGTGTRVHTLRLFRDSDQALIGAGSINFTGLPAGLVYVELGAPVTLLAGGGYRISIGVVGSGDNINQNETVGVGGTLYSAVATDMLGCYSVASGGFPGSNLFNQGPAGLTFKYTSP